MKSCSYILLSEWHCANYSVLFFSANLRCFLRKCSTFLAVLLNLRVMWIMTVYLFLTKHWFAPSLKMSISKFLFVVNKSMFSQGNKYEDSCLILPQESVYVWMWFSEYKYFAFKNDLQHKSNTVQKKKKGYHINLREEQKVKQCLDMRTWL